MAYKDRWFVCVRCGKKFIFTARDQGFYEQSGFKHDPKRCRECRWWISVNQHGEIVYPNGSVEEYWRVPCADCGRPAHVSFKPDFHKPVYCRDCLVARKSREGRDGLDEDQPRESPERAPGS